MQRDMGRHRASLASDRGRSGSPGEDLRTSSFSRQASLQVFASLRVSLDAFVLVDQEKPRCLGRAASF